MSFTDAARAVLALHACWGGLERIAQLEPVLTLHLLQRVVVSKDAVSLAEARAVLAALDVISQDRAPTWAEGKRVDAPAHPGIVSAVEALRAALA